MELRSALEVLGAVESGEVGGRVQHRTREIASVGGWVGE
jgi:hypothetical protein